MDIEDLFPKRADDPLVALSRQDLDPLSVEELERRVAALQSEIVRTKKKMENAVNHRASADALFRK